MKHQVKVPSAGESVAEAYIGGWRKQSGDVVKKGEIIVDLESQKATFELEAEVAGRLEILKPTVGSKVGIGEIIATIDEGEGVLPFVSPPSTSPPPPYRGGEITQMGPAARRGLIAPRAGAPKVAPTSFHYTVDTSRGEKATPATRIRKHIAANLVAAQHTAAILTTFNEIDMSEIMGFRKKYKDGVQKKHGVSVGFVGAYALAAAKALTTYPLVNSMFTGEEIISRDFVDLSIAVATDRGLVVPVIRDVQKLDWIGFEKKLAEAAEKARAGKLSIPEMTGGTFTITNGGVFGSLLATPLLNMPQAAILGMHKIEDRPVVRDGQIVARPMMYVALSYDHRLLDGKEAVEFLVKIKECMENPSLMIDEKALQ